MTFVNIFNEIHYSVDLTFQFHHLFSSFRYLIIMLSCISITIREGGFVYKIHSQRNHSVHYNLRAIYRNRETCALKFDWL